LLDYQLMVVEPVNWIEKCLRGQADRIIGHIEHMESQDEFIGKLQEAGVGVGLALDFETPVARIDKHLLGDLDAVLLMSVKAGFGGQEFKREVLEKIEKLKELRGQEGANYKIHVDGGVNGGNIKDVALAGADEVSIGKRIFEGDLRENIERYMRELER
jgi:ribulose-phosphate 3-epimerase